MNLAVAIAVGFISGSIPVGYVVAKSKGVNIRAQGSGNIGATNVGRVLGAKWGIVCFLLDAAKGLVPTLAYGVLAGLVGRFDLPSERSWEWLAVMISPVLGHVFCPWLGFKGGKGVSTALGSALGVFPALTLPGIGAVVVWFGTLWTTRYVSLSSILAACSFPAWIALVFTVAPDSDRGPSWLARAGPYLTVSVMIGALVAYLHRSNIVRITEGKEPKVKWFGRGRQKPAPSAGTARTSA